MLSNRTGIIFGYYVDNATSTKIIEQHEEFVDENTDFFHYLNNDDMLIGIPVFYCNPEEEEFVLNIGDINEKLNSIPHSKSKYFNEFIAQLQADYPIGLPQLHFVNLFI